MAGQRVISAVLTLRDQNFSGTAEQAANSARELERRVRSSGNAVGRFGRSATAGFSSIAKGAAGLAGAIGITKAVSGGFNMVKNSVSSAMDRIDVMEGFERVMTTLTGSTEKTAAALEATRNAVTGTAYGMDVAAKGVQDFVTRGMDVEKATDTIAAWGDAVAFYGDGSNEQLAGVSDALAKMYSSGKVGMDQMNRLYDAGIDGVGMYAKATGRNASAVQKDLSKGKISAADFIDVVSGAMMEGTNGVVNIAGAAKEAGASWSGSFANMRAAVTRGVESIIGKIDEMLTSNGFPDMRSMVADFGSKFEDTLKKAADYIPPLASGIVDMYARVKPGLSWLKDTAFPSVKDEIVSMYVAAQPGLNWLKDTAFPGIVDGVGFAVEKFTSLYNFVKGNIPEMTPVIAGVAATIAAFKIGIVAVTTAKSIWRGVTTGVQIATALLNGTLAISPLGWVALAIGGVVAAGVLLWQNWDVVKEKAQLLWDKTKEVGAGIQTGFEQAWEAVKTAAGTSINFVIGKINGLIDAINKIPGVNVPIIAQVEWGQAQAPQGMADFRKLESYAVGTNRVKRDMAANIHKDEMIIPAAQSRNLRKQGVTIDNIDRGVLAKENIVNSVVSRNVGNAIVTQKENNSSFVNNINETKNENNRSFINTKNEDKQTVTNIETKNVQNNADLSNLIQQITQLVQLLKNAPKGEVIIKIDGYNKSVSEIINELVPMLKLRIANM